MSAPLETPKTPNPLKPLKTPQITPAQTVGPFYGYALPFTGGGDIAPAGDPRTLTVHGTVRDGEGSPIPDALLEFWQASPEGSRAGAPGSLRRDPVTGAVLGRDGVTFTGFGRVATDADGHYALRTLPPAADAPYLSVVVFARGLLHHLHTRAYLDAGASDALLDALPEQRRATLIARQERDGVHRFDIRIQGDAGEETVFLDFR